MEKINQADMEKALVDVRKAHRLLYEYQHRIVDIMHFVQDKLKFSSLTGNRLFFDTIHSVRGSYGALKVDNIWAWDFLYCYIFEFYLGYKECSQENQSWAYDLSIVEVSDTGYFEAQSSDKHFCNINSYITSEEASTILIFMLQIKPKEENRNIWDNSEFIKNQTEEMLSNSKEELIKKDSGIIFLAKKYNVLDFFSQVYAEKTLTEYIEFVKDKTGIDLNY